jgi:ABC-type uncharacterized transport system permease subunit
MNLDVAFWTALFLSTLRQTTPLLFTALGGMFSERSGVTNIALEGIILFGALTAAVVVERFEAALGPGPHPWLPWVGVLSAMLVGGLIAAVHAVVSIKYRADQIISATALNLLALGAPSLVLTYFYGNATSSKEVVNRLPLLLGLSPWSTWPSSWCPWPGGFSSRRPLASASVPWGSTPRPPTPWG